jgi:hypothetical protein
VDVLFVPHTAGGDIQYNLDGEKKNTTYLEDFLYRFYNFTHRLDGENGYFAQMEKYLNDYYKGDYSNPDNIDEIKIESDFRAKVKETKDKRYKSEEKIQAGVQGEIARFKKYRQALVDFNDYLGKGYIALQEVTLYFTDTNGKTTPITGSFSVNLCPDESLMGDLKKEVYYRVSDEETLEFKSAIQDMNIVIIKDQTKNYGFEFERLGLITYLVQTYCSALNPTA